MSGTGMRRAALALAALHPDDRSWLLERLRPSWRYDLRRLIGQIHVKYVSSADLVHEAIQASKKEAPPETPAPDRLLKGMQGLSPIWCARVLAACAPDHTEMVLAHREASDADLIRSELMALPAIFPPKLAAAMADLIRTRADGRAMSSCEAAS